MRRSAASLALLAPLALAGCITPVTYGAIGADSAYGYRDRQNADGSYTLLAVAPSAPMAHQFWDQRAQELCGGTNFHKNIFRAEIPVVTYTGYVSNAYGGGGSYSEDRYGGFYLEGYLRCGGEEAPTTEPAAVDAPPAQPAPPTH